MSAGSFPSVCIRNIISHLEYDYKSLHTCILLNKNWFLESIDKLWIDPFIYNKKLSSCNKKRNFCLINTYIKCLKPEIRRFLNIKITLNSITCDYIGYLQHIRTEIMSLCILSWLEFTRNILNKNNIFQAICEHIILKSNNIKTIHLHGEMAFNIFKLPDSYFTLSSVKYFKYCLDYTHLKHFEDVLHHATKISKRIEHIEISYISENRPGENGHSNLLPSYLMFGNFMKTQRDLKKLIFRYLDFTSVFNVLKNRTDFNLINITKIQLIGIKHENYQLILNELSLFVNLTHLKIHECSNFYFEEKLFTLTKNNNILLSKLSKISLQNNISFSQEFLNIILIRSGKNIKKLHLYDAIDVKIFPAILACCYNLNYYSCLINGNNYYFIVDIIRNSTNLNRLKIGFYENTNEDSILPISILSDIAKNIKVTLRSLKLSIFLCDDSFLTKEIFIKFFKILSERKVKLKYLKITGWNKLINNTNLINEIITNNCDITNFDVIKICNTSFNK